MTQKTSPFVDTYYGWDLGESGWNTGMDENLIKFSFLFDRNINDIVSSLPVAVNGEAYFNTADSRVYYVIGDTYYSSPLPLWFEITMKSTGAVYIYNGTTLVQRVLNKSEVGLSNVDNTSDINKPISTAQQSALDLKANIASFLAPAGSNLVGFKRPEPSSSERTVQTKLYDYPATSADFNIPSDGVTSAVSGITTALSSGAVSLEFLSGNYLINSSITLDLPIKMRDGAIFVIPDGVILTINNTFNANLERKFNCTGTGKIIFNQAKVSVGYPEWWGAVPNAPGGDCLAAINACIIALPVTQLQQADYYTSGPVLMRTAHRTLRGVMPFVTGNGGQGSGSRIYVKSGSADVVVVGLASDPGSNNTHLYQYGNNVQFVQLSRTIVPVPPAVGNEVNGPAGLRVAFAQFCNFEFVSSEENTLGIVWYGTIRANFKNCYAIRSVAGSTPTNDIFWGFYAPSGVQVGGTQTNASSYLLDCSTTNAYAPAVNCIGLFLAGNARDTFVDRFESATCATGVQVSGAGNTQYGDIDIILRGLYVDAFTSKGIYLSGISSAGAVQVLDGYFAPISTASGGYGVLMAGCNGLIALSNNQIDCNTQPQGDTIGIGIATSSGVVTTGNLINYCRTPVVVNNCVNIDMRDMVHMAIAPITPAVAIQVLGSSNRVKIDTSVYGPANSYSIGIQVPSDATSLSEFRMTGINSSCLTVAGNKLHYNGSQVTTSGTFGNNNLAQGIMD